MAHSTRERTSPSHRTFPRRRVGRTCRHGDRSASVGRLAHTLGEHELRTARRLRDAPAGKRFRPPCRWSSPLWPTHSRSRRFLGFEGTAR
jgi:hypothetical protein